MPPPASSSGTTIPRCRAHGAPTPAATWSTAASRVWKGRVYVGTLDGRLIALDARPASWSGRSQTTDRSRPYTITGAPRVVKGKVIIGNGGAEYGVRGYVTAYDAETGEQVWRFYTVPGDPAKRLRDAATWRWRAKTWNADAEWWKRAAAAARCGTPWPTTRS